MDIQLNEREILFLKQYAEKYEKEREIDSTAKPIVVVEVQQEVPADIEYGYEKITYVWDSELYDGEDELEKILKENDFSPNEISNIFTELNENGEALSGSIQRIYANIVWDPVAYFLTRAEAEKYCKYQKHNLRSPRVYSRYVGYGNKGDLECLMELLLKVGKQIIKEEKPNINSFIEKRFLEKK